MGTSFGVAYFGVAPTVSGQSIGSLVAGIGSILVFTLGYSSIYGRLQEQLTSLSPGKALWLSHGFMAARVVLGLGVLFTVGWLLVHADLLR